MTLKEKSKKKPGEKSTKKPSVYSFSEIVDDACEGLMDCQIKYSIRRLQEMKDYLCVLEQELDVFLDLKTANQ